jgi:hypothetical protein
VQFDECLRDLLGIGAVFNNGIPFRVNLHAQDACLFLVFFVHPDNGLFTPRREQPVFDENLAAEQDDALAALGPRRSRISVEDDRFGIARNVPRQAQDFLGRDQRAGQSRQEHRPDEDQPLSADVPGHAASREMLLRDSVWPGPGSSSAGRSLSTGTLAARGANGNG